jgi:photosystem II stability/assembly factor-like uncharacterized protein
MIKKTFILISFLFLFITTNTAQWTWVELPSPGGFPLCLYHNKINDDIYIGCWGGVWKLISSTNQWIEVDSDPNENILANAKILSLLLDSQNVFYAGTDDRTNAYISFDGGNKWSQINDASFTLQRINCIVETLNGSILFGTNSGIIKTADHGKTFNKISGFTSAVLSFAVNTNGDVWLGAQGGIYKSTDNGDTWIKKSSGLILSLQYLSIGIGSDGRILTGCNQDIFRSENYGESWISLKTPPRGDYGLPILTDLIVVNNNVIYGCFNRFPYSTTDFGNSWTAIGIQISGTDQPWSYQQIRLNNKGELFARKEDRNLYKGSNATSVEYNNIPTEFQLSQNYPNPFNPVTVISYQLPVGSHVQLKVYDIIGREVTTLVNEFKPPGSYNSQFSILNFPLPSGIYFYTLKAGDYISTKKMVLLK